MHNTSTTQEEKFECTQTRALKQIIVNKPAGVMRKGSFSIMYYKKPQLYCIFFAISVKYFMIHSRFYFFIKSGVFYNQQKEEKKN